MEILVTSPEGLYYASASGATIARVYHGGCFGIAHHTKSGRWFISRSSPGGYTAKGKLTSFCWDEKGKQIYDVTEIQGIDIDNNTHQLCISGDHIYVQETVFQKTRVFDLNTWHEVYCHIPEIRDDKTVANAHMVLCEPDKYTCDGYLHMNAVAIRNGLLYISCPQLRNHIDGLRVANLAIDHHIRVYQIPDADIDIEMEPGGANTGAAAGELVLKKRIDVRGHSFCHDLVFNGDMLYITSPPNKLVEIDMKSESNESAVFHVFEDPRCFLIRGLCISNSCSDAVVGFRGGNNTICQPDLPLDQVIIYPRMLAWLDMTNTRECVLKEIPFTPCCIASVNGV